MRMSGFPRALRDPQPPPPPPPPPPVETGSDAGADNEGDGYGGSNIRTSDGGTGSDDEADGGGARETYFLSAGGGRSSIRTNLGGTDDDADDGEARETDSLSDGAAGGGRSTIRTNLGGTDDEADDEGAREAYFLSAGAAGGGRSSIRTNLDGSGADGGETREAYFLSDGADGGGTDPDQGVLRGDGGNGTRVFSITVGAELVDLTVEEGSGSYEYGVVIYDIDECDGQGANCFTPSNLSGLENFTVHLETEDGTAVGGNGSAEDDYESLNTSVTFSPSDFGCVICGARKLVRGEIYDDDLFERDETFVIRLRGAADNSPFIRVAPAESTVTIPANDIPPLGRIEDLDNYRVFASTGKYVWTEPAGVVPGVTIYQVRYRYDDDEAYRAWSDIGRGDSASGANRRSFQGDKTFTENYLIQVRAKTLDVTGEPSNEVTNIAGTRITPEVPLVLRVPESIERVFMSVKFTTYYAQPPPDLGLKHLTYSTRLDTALPDKDYITLSAEVPFSTGDFMYDADGDVYILTVGENVEIVDDKIFEGEEELRVVVERTAALPIQYGTPPAELGQGRGFRLIIEDDDAPQPYDPITDLRSILSADGTQAQLSWAAPPQEAACAVNTEDGRVSCTVYQYRSSSGTAAFNDADWTNITVTKEGAQRLWTVEGLDAAQTYFFQVRAVTNIAALAELAFVEDPLAYDFKSPAADARNQVRIRLEGTAVNSRLQETDGVWRYELIARAAKYAPLNGFNVTLVSRDINATAGSDYEGLNRTLAFSPQDFIAADGRYAAIKNVTAALIDDLLAEEDETFEIVISSFSAAADTTLLPDGEPVTYTIVANDLFQPPARITQIRADRLPSEDFKNGNTTIPVRYSITPPPGALSSTHYQYRDQASAQPQEWFNLTDAMDPRLGIPLIEATEITRAGAVFTYHYLQGVAAAELRLRAVNGDAAGAESELLSFPLRMIILRGSPVLISVEEGEGFHYTIQAHYEGAAPPDYSFTLTLVSGECDVPLIECAVGRNATAGEDYASFSRQLRFTPSDFSELQDSEVWGREVRVATRTVVIATLEDAADERTERFALSIRAPPDLPTHVLPRPGRSEFDSAVVRILDDDRTAFADVMFSPSEDIQLYASEVFGPLVPLRAVTRTASAPSEPYPVRVIISSLTSGFRAEFPQGFNPADFFLVNGRYQDDQALSISALIAGDPADGDRAYRVELHSADAEIAAVDPAAASFTLVILDDSDSFTAADARIIEETLELFENEPDAGWTLEVRTREGADRPPSDYSFTYIIAGGAADFTNHSGNITFAAGDFELRSDHHYANRTIPLRPLNDAVLEGDENYTLRLRAHANSTAFTFIIANDGIISDNDTLAIRLRDDDYPKPTALRATAAPYTAAGAPVEFMWNYPAADLRGYQVQWRISDYFSRSAITAVPSYSRIFAAELGTDNLTVRVRAQIDAGIYSDWSDPIMLSLPFNVPRRFEATARGTDVTLRWEHPSPNSIHRDAAFGYGYQYSQNGGAWTDATGPSLTEHTLRGLAAASTYRFRLRIQSDTPGVASAATREVIVSTEAAPTAAEQKPDAVDDLRGVVLDANRLRLIWTAPAHATPRTRYQYRQRTSGAEYDGWSSLSPQRAGGRLSGVIGGLDNDAVGFFQVRAINGNLFANPSNEAENLVRLSLQVRGGGGEEGGALVSPAEPFALSEAAGTYPLEISLSTNYPRRPRRDIQLNIATGNDVNERFPALGSLREADAADYDALVFSLRFAPADFVEDAATGYWTASKSQTLRLVYDFLVEGDEYFHLRVDAAGGTPFEFTNAPYEIIFRLEDASAPLDELGWTFDGYDAGGNFNITFAWEYDDPRLGSLSFVIEETIAGERNSYQTETGNTEWTRSYTPAELGKTLVYRVGLEETGDFSERVSLLVPFKPPALTALGGGESITLEWTLPTDLSGIAGYQYQQDGGDWTEVPGSDARASRHTVTGLAAATTSAYRVRALTSLGIPSQATSEASASTEAAADAAVQKPGRIEDLRGAADGGDFILNWTAPANTNASTVYEYRRRRDIADYGEWMRMEDPMFSGGNYTYALSLPDDNSDYFFRVRARNGVLVGDASNEVTSSVRLRPLLLDPFSARGIEAGAVVYVAEETANYTYILNVTTDRSFQPRRDYRIRVYTTNSPPRPLPFVVNQATTEDYIINSTIHHIAKEDFIRNQATGLYVAQLNITFSVLEDAELEGDEYFYLVMDQAPNTPAVFDETPYILAVRIVDDDRRPENLRFARAYSAGNLTVHYEWDYAAPFERFEFERVRIEDFNQRRFGAATGRNASGVSFTESYRPQDIGRILIVRVRAEIVPGILSEYSDYLEVPLPREGFAQVLPARIRDLRSETLRSGEVRLQWTLPRNTYSATVFEYRRRENEGAYGGWMEMEELTVAGFRAGGSQAAYVISDINNDNYYRFQVRALNGMRNATASDEADNPLWTEASLIEDYAEEVSLYEDYGADYKHYILFTTDYNRRPRRSYRVAVATTDGSANASDYAPIAAEISVEPADFFPHPDEGRTFIALKEAPVAVTDDNESEADEFFHIAVDALSDYLYLSSDAQRFTTRVVIIDNDRAPLLTNLRRIGVTDDSSPYFFFDSSEAGRIIYADGCAAHKTHANAGHTVVAELLNASSMDFEDGLYNCTLTLSVSESLSNTMEIPPFMVNASYQNPLSDPLFYEEADSYSLTNATDGGAAAWLPVSDETNLDGLAPTNRSIIIEVNDLYANRSRAGGLYGGLELADPPLTRKENGNYILNVVYKLLRLTR